MVSFALMHGTRLAVVHGVNLTLRPCLLASALLLWLPCAPAAAEDAADTGPGQVGIELMAGGGVFVADGRAGISLSAGALARLLVLRLGAEVEGGAVLFGYHYSAPLVVGGAGYWFGNTEAMVLIQYGVAHYDAYGRGGPFDDDPGASVSLPVMGIRPSVGVRSDHGTGVVYVARIALQVQWDLEQKVLQYEYTDEGSFLADDPEDVERSVRAGEDVRIGIVCRVGILWD